MERPPDLGVVPPTGDALPFERLRRVAAVVDLREIVRGKALARGQAKGTRRIDNVDALCLHQTAAPIAAASRFLNVPAHGAVLPDGTIVLLHPLTAHLWHAHALNRSTIGIEISCRADGVDGDQRTFWRSKREQKEGKTRDDLRVEMTEDQAEAARALCRYYVDEVARLGGKIGRIVAHRQGHRSRVADPGSRIWQRVALPSADELGLDVGVDGYTRGSGRPIPRAWDPRCRARYSWRVR
jgi:N-acetyl-anhydromuramyl-L-alanine amidase AmpD